MSVEGTTWVGADSDGDEYTYHFLRGNTLTYTSPTGTYSGEPWEQHGNTVSWNMNDHYADYSGTIVGKTMSGTARNVTGKHWTWSLTLQETGTR
jgi:hypothetical protein